MGYDSFTGLLKNHTLGLGNIYIEWRDHGGYLPWDKLYILFIV